MKSTLLLEVLIIHLVSSLRINTSANAKHGKGVNSASIAATAWTNHVAGSRLFMSAAGDNDDEKSELLGIGGKDGSIGGDELPDDAFGAPVGPLPSVSSNINMEEVVVDENNLGEYNSSKVSWNISNLFLISLTVTIHNRIILSQS